jgi:hypothetical protein
VERLCKSFSGSRSTVGSEAGGRANSQRNKGIDPGRGTIYPQLDKTTDCFGAIDLVSLSLPDEVIVEIGGWAKSKKLTRSAAIRRLLEAGAQEAFLTV